MPTGIGLNIRAGGMELESGNLRSVSNFARWSRKPCRSISILFEEKLNPITSCAPTTASWVRTFVCAAPEVPRTTAVVTIANDFGRCMTQGLLAICLNAILFMITFLGTFTQKQIPSSRNHIDIRHLRAVSETFVFLYVDRKSV